MGDIIKTIWGQTKLVRGALAIGLLATVGVCVINEIEVPGWYQTLATTGILSYFVTRGTETIPG